MRHASIKLRDSKWRWCVNHDGQSPPQLRRVADSGRQHQHLDAPDHTTLSRRSAKLSIALRPCKTTGAIHLVIDSSGLAIFGQGDWAAAKHARKGMQGWKTLHLGVDQTGSIVAPMLTDANADDATAGIGLPDQIDVKIKPVSRMRSSGSRRSSVVAFEHAALTPRKSKLDSRATF